MHTMKRKRSSFSFAITAFVFLLLDFVCFRPAQASGVVAAPISFPAGSLIIPMDTDGNGQDLGMLRAYGLVYDLLKNNVPVQWVIDPLKGANGNDFTIGSGGNTLVSSRSGAIIALPRPYRGGPFVIASADAAAALPIIQAWQATSGDNTEVHQLTSGAFSANVARVLLKAPRIAILLDGNQQIAFNDLNAAGIPDALGNSWSASSPDVLSESAVAGPTATDHSDGALFHASSGLPRYCFMIAMHYNASPLTSEVAAETRSWLNNDANAHLFAQCEAARVFENEPNGLFLTNAGLADDGNATTNPVIRRSIPSPCSDGWHVRG